jgi:hypothetical protein
MAKQTFTTGQVLTAAEMTSLQANDYNQTVSAKTANYVLVAADAGTRITMSNAGATTITVNTSLFTAGDTLFITNIGAGATTITAGTATVSTASTLVLAQYDSGRLYFTSTGVAIWEKYQGAAASGGKVLQVVMGTSTSQTSVASTTYVDTTITANITPSAASSKVLVLWSTTCTKAAATGSGGNFRLVRGATALTLAEGVGYDFQATGNRYTAAQNYLDSPSTTSSTTYKVQFATFSGTDAIYAQVSSSTGSIILLEIGA